MVVECLYKYSEWDDAGFCPECDMVYLKDDKCEHVTCELKYKIDFCFKCSYYRSPILVHGNHYHRQQ